MLVMVLDMYQKPQRTVEDVSALGLHHVGYGIPTDLFGPLVTGCVQVVMTLTDNAVVEVAFRRFLIFDFPIVDPHVQGGLHILVSGHQRECR